MDVPGDLVQKGLEELDLTRSKTSDGVQTYKLGDWKLQSGRSLPNAHIAYKTFGDPKSPAIIYPSWYSGCELTYHFPPNIADHLSNCRQRMAHRRRQSPHSQEIFHNHHRPLRQWPIHFPLQLRYQALPRLHLLRQCPRSAPTRDPTLGRHACSRGTRLVHGCRPDLPMGNPIP
jgi:hypothetical protein